MNLYYTPPNYILGDILRIEGQEMIHAVKVMRQKTGDMLDVTDGTGYRYKSEITHIGKREIEARITERFLPDAETPELILVMGIIKKKDRLEFAIEKAVELGVSKIALFDGDHTEKKGVRIDRLETIAISAMKQSLRTYLPGIVHYKSLDKCLSDFNDAKILIADEVADKQSGIQLDDGNSIILIVIGPEGGFSEKERALWNKYPVERITLGTHRLRAETAAISACALIKDKLRA